MLSEKNILSVKDGNVTFRYTENTGTIKTRTLPGEEFLWLLLQHVLPKGFRRARDYGFLHPNSKPLIRLIQLLAVGNQSAMMLRVTLSQNQRLYCRYERESVDNNTVHPNSGLVFF